MNEMKPGKLRDVPDRLYGDQIRLKQILINLVKNALKFTYNGKISLRAGYDDENELLYVSVQDTGYGLKREEMT